MYEGQCEMCYEWKDGHDDDLCSGCTNIKIGYPAIFMWMKRVIKNRIEEAVDNLKVSIN